MQVIISDIETLKECFLCVCYDPEIDKYQSFKCHKGLNEIDKMVAFFESKKEHYFVFYNGLRFDSQVLEFIIRNHHNWNELSCEEICLIIYQVAQDTIHDSNFGLLPKYRERELSFKILDLFEIHHFSNKNRMVSLKRLEFEMDLENIEEMPIKHDKIGMTDEELSLTESYCINDVHATYQFYLVTIGETDHPLYKGNNQIELRQDIEAEFGIPCLNYSDSKIGDEMIKKYYCQEKGIEYKELPKKGLFRSPFTVKSCVAPYVEFQTPELQGFLKRINKITLKLQDDFKEELHFYGNVYSFMKGGLHTENKPMIFEANNEYEIIDWDVSSYYPAIIINNGRYPGHLGKEFLRGYKTMFDKRLELKPLAKKDKKIKGIVGALKLAVNSVYGKSSDMQNWIYDRQLTMFTTITGELSLMMLIEAYELAGINVISANTDGVTIRIKKTLLDKMFEINKWWCETTQYELERADYQKIIFSTVNDYIAIKTDGEIKKKGDFLTDFELHKNKSARIVSLALEQYFVNNIPINNTISSHNNIYDFCLRQKASKDFHYEGIKYSKSFRKVTDEEFKSFIETGGWVKGKWWDGEEYWTNDEYKPNDHFGGYTDDQLRSILQSKINFKEANKTVYDKLIRYYVSNTGEKLLKVKNADSNSTAPAVAQVEAGEWVCTVCNYLPKDTDVATAGINYEYYIQRAQRIIDKIELQGKRRKFVDPAQTSLF